MSFHRILMGSFMVWNTLSAMMFSTNSLINITEIQSKMATNSKRRSLNALKYTIAPCFNVLMRLSIISGLITR